MTLGRLLFASISRAAKQLPIAAMLLLAVGSSGAQVSDGPWQSQRTNGVSVARIRRDLYVEVQTSGDRYLVTLDFPGTFTEPQIADSDVWLLTTNGSSKVPGVDGGVLGGRPTGHVQQQLRVFRFEKPNQPMAIAVRIGQDFFILRTPAGH